jgi:hypothetical protein
MKNPDHKRAGRELADFDRLHGPRTQAAGGMRPKANYLAYWVTYPITLLECLLMAGVALLGYGACRAIYFRVWYPEAARHRPNRLAKQKIDTENALGVMQTLERISHESRARLYWISGTLLGLERLGRPLPHDNDMDAGVNVDDPHYQDFIRAMWASADVVTMAPQRISLKIRIQNPDLHVVPGGIIRYKSHVRNRNAPDKPPVKTDIFLHFNYCGGSMHGSQNSLWWNSTFSVVQKSYAENIFSVPENRHLHLTENYGNYRDEVKDFENSIDCPNAMNIFSWMSLAYLLSRMQVMLKRGRIDRAGQINQRIRATILKGALPLCLRQPKNYLGS